MGSCEASHQSCYPVPVPLDTGSPEHQSGHDDCKWSVHFCTCTCRSYHPVVLCCVVQLDRSVCVSSAVNVITSYFTVLRTNKVCEYVRCTTTCTLYAYSYIYMYMCMYNESISIVWLLSLIANISLNYQLLWRAFNWWTRSLPLYCPVYSCLSITLWPPLLCCMWTILFNFCHSMLCALVVQVCIRWNEVVPSVLTSSQPSSPLLHWSSTKTRLVWSTEYEISRLY